MPSVNLPASSALRRSSPTCAWLTQATSSRRERSEATVPHRGTGPGPSSARAVLIFEHFHADEELPAPGSREPAGMEVELEYEDESSPRGARSRRRHRRGHRERLASRADDEAGSGSGASDDLEKKASRTRKDSRPYAMRRSRAGSLVGSGGRTCYR